MSPCPPPNSCDTFVVLPDVTKGGHVVFGKNSDRPNEEVQEVIYRQPADHEDGTKLQCTYIEIDQVSHTHAVILSKPSWMWGAEMGSNEHGVCVGNEAVWTKLQSDEDSIERLLGMDLVRLALERSSTAEMAVEVITSLLEEHGQGGPCSDAEPNLLYHNSFLIADHQEAWILETADKHWAAEQVKSGYRNISNALSIGTKIDKMSEGLKEFAQEKGWWDGNGDFNFSEAYAEEGDPAGGRKECGEKLLAKLSAGGNFDLQSMFSVLRDKKSGICMSAGMFVSTSSQVSVISHGSGRPSCHWFTGTPDPQRSVFKPFIFTNNVKISPHIQSPKIPDDEDPAKVTPRFAKKVNRSHLLYRRQQAATLNGGSIVNTLRDLERNCVKETEACLQSFDPERLSEMDDLFKDCVDSELKFYK
ncbi:secernin-3-like isoform X2 [Homarus americanus]|uniref:secernin-3-like isoform X2 n=1 Tax=Homarus americanus TaxID=6706 RepID=UPI001C481AE5|nr:secernin-3-like isoform X2 [Homarus americanus]